MTSRIRASISALLCSLILLGHVPAWIHVASCENCCQDYHSHVLTGSSHAHSHCCCTESDGKSGENLFVSDGEESSSSNHDSDRCAVCQSLSGVTSAACAVLDLPIVDGLCETVTVFCFQSPALVCGFVACPRGPPALFISSSVKVW